MDDRKSTPPPVLTKKPSVPVKKSPTTSISSMTGSLFSGLKSKVKGMDNKNSTSQDSFDGIGSSKNASNVADNNEKGIIGEKLRKDDSDFDHVERGSMLQDMRASRAKAPKKRPPSAAINIIGDNNNKSSLMNGSNSLTDTSIDSSPPQHNDEELTKPKPREWEKHKAPWMEELKASQMKKTSPNSTSFDMSKSPESSKTLDTSTTSSSSSFSEHHHYDTSTNLKLNDMSKSFSSSYMSNNRKSSVESSNSIEVRNNNSIEVKSATLIQKEIESQNQAKKSVPPLSGTTKISIIDNTITPLSSLSSSSTTASVSSSSSLSSSSTNSSVSERIISTIDDQTVTQHKSARPLSVNLRNRSISPTNISSTTAAAAVTTTNNRVAGTKSIHVMSPDPLASIPIATKLNHHQHHLNNDTSSTIITSSAILSSSTTSAVTTDNVCSRVSELELRVSKLEKLVQMQNVTIEDLVKTLRDEKDKVKILKTELDKYAQCVTQV